MIEPTSPNVVVVQQGYPQQQGYQPQQVGYQPQPQYAPQPGYPPMQQPQGYPQQVAYGSPTYATYPGQQAPYPGGTTVLPCAQWLRLGKFEGVR
jgi:hypothetical protein